LSAAGGTLQRIPRLLLPLSDDAFTPPPPSLGPQRSAALNGGGDGSAIAATVLGVEGGAT